MALPLKLSLGAGGLVLISGLVLASSETPVPPTAIPAPNMSQLQHATSSVVNEVDEKAEAESGQELKQSPSKKRTSESQGCHQSYSGCLKMGAGDYDCVGGSGNGPNYTSLVQVVGPDVFGLDRDGNGVGCE